MPEMNKNEDPLNIKHTKMNFIFNFRRKTQKLINKPEQSIVSKFHSESCKQLRKRIHVKNEGKTYVKRGNIMICMIQES